MNKFITIVLALANSFFINAQINTTILQGNDFYRQQQYDKAAGEYQNVLQQAPGNNVAKFNLANSLVKQGKAGDGDKLYMQLDIGGNNIDVRSQASYNRGVLFSQQKKLEESVSMYEEALRLNPNDKEARENLQKALLELKKKNPPKKPDEQKKKQQQQKQQPKPKITPKEAQEQLKLLEQKEKEVQERLQKNNANTGNSQPKDW